MKEWTAIYLRGRLCGYYFSVELRTIVFLMTLDFVFVIGEMLRKEQKNILPFSIYVEKQ